MKEIKQKFETIPPYACPYSDCDGSKPLRLKKITRDENAPYPITMQVLCDACKQEDWITIKDEQFMKLITIYNLLSG